MAQCKRCRVEFNTITTRDYCTDRCEYIAQAKEIADLKAQVAQLNDELSREFPRVCHWSEDEEGNWFGKCGIGWTFNDIPATPLDHGMKYCPRCAGVLMSKTYEEAKAKDGD